MGEGVHGGPHDRNALGVGRGAVMVAKGSGTLQGKSFVDGPLINAPVRTLRAGGWAAACKEDSSSGSSSSEEVRFSISYGELPVPRPTSLAAEVWAILMCLRHASTHVEAVVTDCSTVVKGLLRGRTWATASGRAQAHLWVMVWDKLDDLGMVPGEHFQVLKVKAHKRRADKDRLEQLASQGLCLPGVREAGMELQHTRMNEVVDFWAKRGAALAQVPQGKLEAAKEHLDKCKSILEYIAHYRCRLDGVKSTTWQPTQRRGKPGDLKAARARRQERLVEQRQRRS